MLHQRAHCCTKADPQSTLGNLWATLPLLPPSPFPLAAPLPPQAAAFCSLTSSLSAMCTSVWPGLTDEGILFFKVSTGVHICTHT